MKRIEEFYINDLFVSVFGNQKNVKNILFIHGGPGLNSQPITKYLEEIDGYNSLDANIIFYDQRGCGKSTGSTDNNNYSKQIEDLLHVIKELKSTKELSAIIGHSYGAKLVNDFLKTNPLDIPVILMSTSNTIDTPREKNILLDLEYLKEVDYDEFQRISALSKRAPLWEVTDSLADVFNSNPNRIKRYWHNQQIMKKYLETVSRCDYKINSSVFVGIREELYNSYNRKLNLFNEGIYHFIGAHDYIMEGEKYIDSNKSIVFQHSAHYPHLEEPEIFCKALNEII